MAYAIEALMGYMDGATSLGTMPWMVTLFGIVVLPLGVVRVIHLRRAVMEFGSPLFT